MFLKGEKTFRNFVFVPLCLLLSLPFPITPLLAVLLFLFWMRRYFRSLIGPSHNPIKHWTTEWSEANEAFWNFNFLIFFLLLSLSSQHYFFVVCFESGYTRRHWQKLNREMYILLKKFRYQRNYGSRGVLRTI